MSGPPLITEGLLILARALTTRPDLSSEDVIDFFQLIGDLFPESATAHELWNLVHDSLAVDL